MGICVRIAQEQHVEHKVCNTVNNIQTPLPNLWKNGSIRKAQDLIKWDCNICHTAMNKTEIY